MKKVFLSCPTSPFFKWDGDRAGRKRYKKKLKKLKERKEKKGMNADGKNRSTGLQTIVNKGVSKFRETKIAITSPEITSLKYLSAKRDHC